MIVIQGKGKNGVNFLDIVLNNFWETEKLKSDESGAF